MRFIRYLTGSLIVAFGGYIFIIAIQAGMQQKWEILGGGILIGAFIVMLGLVFVFDGVKRFFKELFSNFYWW
jgi:hypothetical protein